MKNSLILGLIAAAALVAGVLLALNISPGSQQAPKYLQQYPQPRELPTFSLTDQHQQAFTNEALKGHWTLTFVGYTFCPDICPTTLADLTQVYPALQQVETEQPLQVLFISVDPARDTPERLNQYISFFNPQFHAVTGEHSALFPVVRSMGMMYSIGDAQNDPNYLVDHSASVVVINPHGQVIGRFRPEMQPGKLATSDMEQILADMPLLLSRS